MPKTLLIIVIVGIALAGCGESVTSGDTICGMTDRTLTASDVFGTGTRSEYRDEFVKKTGCQNALNCTETMTIREEICIDNIKVK